MPMYVSPTLLSLIDTAVVGQVSAIQLAAMGPACAICDAITGMMVFISVGTTNAVSTAVGSGDAHAAKRAASVSVVASFSIGCAIAVLLGLCVGPLVAKLALPSAVASTMARTGGDMAAVAATQQLWASCVTYVRIRALSFPAALVLMSAQASCLGAKDSRSPTVATLVASSVNLVGDALLVLGPLSLGIAGAAWATVGCQLAAAGLLLRTLRRKGLVDAPALRTAPSRAELRRFFAFGAFILVLLSKQVVYNQAVLLAAVLGTVAGAAHQCLYALFRLCCTLGDVTGATAQAFLPQYYRQLRPGGKVVFDAAAARGTVRRIVAMTAIVAACNTAITFAVPLLRPGLFTTNLEVMRLMRRAAPIAAAGLLMHPSVVGMEGCLLATKDVRWLVSNYVATGALSVLATQLLLRLAPLRRLLDLNAIWWYLAVYQALRFVTFVWRLLASNFGAAESDEGGCAEVTE